MSHRRDEHEHVVRRVVLALPSLRGEPRPVDEPLPRLGVQARAAAAHVPLLGGEVRPGLRREQHRGVVHHPVVLGVAAVERVAGIIAQSSSGFSGRVAVLVGEKLRYGRARQLGAFLSGYGISSEPFYIRDDAIRWLKS